MSLLYESALHRNHLFCETGEFLKGLSFEEIREFGSLVTIESYPPSAVLFDEKDMPSEMFVLLEGRVKLYMDSSLGKRLIVRIARSGELLGPISVFSSSPFELSAETLSTCRIASIRHGEFHGFLKRHPPAYEGLACQLGRDYKCVCERLRTVGLPCSAQNRLARLLLEWCATRQQAGGGMRLRLTLTQKEIGEFIGLSREAVSRALRDLGRLRLVYVCGRTLTIPSRVALAHYVDLQARSDERKSPSPRPFLTLPPADREQWLPAAAAKTTAAD
jgi:CRP/FNR family transcriptional regulator, cyclic AMP receptor protein